MTFLRSLAVRTGLSRALYLQSLVCTGVPAATTSVPFQGPASCLSRRAYSKLEDHQDEVDAINDKFVEARDEIEYAMEDAETVYFNESADDAKGVVQETLDLYQALRDRLDPDERSKLERSMGLKMEQLKAEAAQLDTLHAD